MLERIYETGEVAHAYLDTRIKFLGSANDSLYSEQWYLSHTGVNSVWDLTSGSESIVVAVIDRGIDFEHEDLLANIWENPNEIPGDMIDNDGDSSWYGSPLVDDIYGWDFLDGDNDPRPNPSDSHGTACAGLISATRNNTIGVAGVAGGNNGTGPKLVSLRTWHGTEVGDAIEYCWRKGVDVVSMSIAVFDQGGVVAAQFDSAYAHGVVLVAAAGNNTIGDEVVFPATDPNVIAVGATDMNDERFSYSAFGQTLELMAPSGTVSGPEPQIYTTDNYQTGGGYNPSICACPAANDRYFSKFSGTSAAAPQVAGIAALLLSHRPSLGNSGVRLLLARTAVDLGDPGWDELTGYGRVDALAAITMADQIVQGQITTNTTWSGAVWMAGDVTVSSGVILTVDPGTTILIDKNDGQASGFYPDKIEFNIEGSIDINGTANSPVTFRSFDGQAGDWIGFYLDVTSGGGSFDYVEIKDAEYGIETYVGIQVNNATFANCAYAGFVAQDGSSQVTSTAITDCGAWGVYNTAPGTDTLRVNSCFVDGAAAAAFHVQNGSISLLDGVTGRNGVKGVYIALLASASISNSTFSANDTGVHCYGGTVTPFTSSHADTNANEGLLCDGGVGLAIVTGSSFDANESGIVALNNSDLYIRGCQLNVNYVGMWCA